MSNAEETLALHIRASRLPIPVREFKFHPVRKWRFDFAYPEKLIAIEVEGGVWSGGRHTRGKGFSEDCVKYNQASLLGWRILRFTPDMISSGEAIKTMEDILKR